jgi:hypothetical protein
MNQNIQAWKTAERRHRLIPPPLVALAMLDKSGKPLREISLDSQDRPSSMTSAALRLMRIKFADMLTLLVDRCFRICRKKSYLEFRLAKRTIKLVDGVRHTSERM